MEPETIPIETIETQPAVQLPTMNIVAQEIPKKEELVAASADNLGKFCEEILTDIRSDGDQLNNVIKNFMDMVLNDGDASSSSKEALVNLIKMKTDLADKKTKVMDLLMRAYLKESNTFPKYLAAHQHNQINIDGGRRALIQQMKETKNEQK